MAKELSLRKAAGKRFRGLCPGRKADYARPMRYVGISSFALLLCACGVEPELSAPPEVAGEARAVGVTTDILVRPRARPDGFDIAAVPEEAAPAALPVAGNGSLGLTVASLGNPAEAGLWLKTPLVTSETTGRVVYPKTGQSVNVTLIPLDGPPTAGSQLSLSAMQGLGAGLADLPTVEVFL